MTINLDGLNSTFGTVAGVGVGLGTAINDTRRAVNSLLPNSPASADLLIGGVPRLGDGIQILIGAAAAQVVSMAPGALSSATIQFSGVIQAADVVEVTVDGVLVDYDVVASSTTTNASNLAAALAANPSISVNWSCYAVTDTVHIDSKVPGIALNGRPLTAVVKGAANITAIVKSGPAMVGGLTGDTLFSLAMRLANSINSNPDCGAVATVVPTLLGPSVHMVATRKGAGFNSRVLTVSITGGPAATLTATPSSGTFLGGTGPDDLLLIL
jgi:hypothetical protein